MALSSFLILALPCVLLTSGQKLTLKSSTKMPHAGFTYLSDEDTRHPSLLVTQFAPFWQDTVSLIDNIDKLALSDAEPHVTTLASNVKWPNFAGSVPKAVGDKHPAYLIAGGFLVPGKTPGCIYLADLKGSSTKISHDKKGYFYHKAVWQDMNGDGHPDILTARAMKPAFGSAKAEFLWLEEPAEGPWSGPWKEHIMFEGPGVNFLVEDFNGDGQVDIMAAEFFEYQGLYYYTCSQPDTSLANCTKFREFKLDEDQGPFFDLQHVDLNGDGVKDILATTNKADGTGSVNAYQLSAKLTDPVVRFTLSKGYEPHKSIINPNVGGPGTALAFNVKGLAKPYILVSGDDSGIVNLLIPAHPTNASDWTYEERRVVTSSGTVGRCTPRDVKGDDTLFQLFIPHYKEQHLDIYHLEI